MLGSFRKVLTSNWKDKNWIVGDSGKVVVCLIEGKIIKLIAIIV